jgi:hypothetical protein
VAAEGEIGLDAVFERSEAQLLEARGLGLREGLVREVGKRRPPPEGECVAEEGRAVGRVRERTRLRDEPLELRRVELLRTDREHVAGPAREQAVSTHELAEARHVALERRAGRVRRRAGPERVDELLGRDGLVRAQQEGGEDGALLRASERDLAPVLHNRQRTEHSKLHPSYLPRKPVRTGILARFRAGPLAAR